jgi:hypothetical protein
MNLSTALSLVSAATISASLVACVAGGSDQVTPPEPAATAIGHVHLMLTEQAQAAVDAQRAGEVQRDPGGEATLERRGSAKTLTYYGGPVVQSVHVTPVFWNSKVEYQSNLAAFYDAIVTGAEMTFLSAYSTSSPKQTIGSGSHGTAFVDTQTATSVTDAQVQSRLASLFTAGSLPKPTNNNYYPVHFPAGVSISDGSGNTSCVQFCAYHGTFTYNGQDVYYGILPDVGQSGCAGGCGGSTVLNNATSVASHEFAETVTDPAVGLAQTYGPPLGWYNKTYGEIGDICNGQQTTATLGDGKSYTVQKLWSNASNACVTP